MRPFGRVVPRYTLRAVAGDTFSPFPGVRLYYFKDQYNLEKEPLHATRWTCFASFFQR